MSLLDTFVAFDLETTGLDPRSAEILEIGAVRVQAGEPVDWWAFYDVSAFEGQAPFGAESIKKIAQLKQVYGLQLTSADAHRLREGEPLPRPGAARGRSGGRRSASG